jgi:hypothetical protein
LRQPNHREIRRHRRPIDEPGAQYEISKYGQVLLIDRNALRNQRFEAIKEFFYGLVGFHASRQPNPAETSAVPRQGHENLSAVLQPVDESDFSIFANR